jgi:hypothetical protein
MSSFVPETWKKQWAACWSAPFIMLPLSVVVVVGLLLAATLANAMTGHDFLQESDKSASDAAAVLRPLVRQFVKEGYHNVPDWAELRYIVRALILKKGYSDKDITEITREAAIAHGMSK